MTTWARDLASWRAWVCFLLLPLTMTAVLIVIVGTVLEDCIDWFNEWKDQA
jgi:hypothetical protein